MRRTTTLLGAALLALAAAPVAAQDASPEMPTEAGTAMVRVLHASPDAPEVDIYLDGAAVGDPLAALAFGAISPYVPVPAGPHAIKVCATADATVCPIDVPELTVEDGMSYTIAATNALASIEAQVLVDTDTRRPRERAGARGPLLGRCAGGGRPDPGRGDHGRERPRLPQRHRVPRPAARLV